MQKKQITYVVNVDFPPGTSEQTIHLWADGIARGIEHNKPEVKLIDYDIQDRSNDFEVTRPTVDPHPFYPQAAPEPKELPEKTDGEV